jgi:P27 family predicted phage terminase small subunit
MPLGKSALEFWKQVTPVLADAGVLERIDLFMLALAASAWGDVMKAERVLAEDGFFQLGSVGQVKEHSALKIKREATLTFERLANHLCLSPVARTRLGLAALTAQVMSHEMDELIGPDTIDADAEYVDAVEVGVPGL